MGCVVDVDGIDERRGKVLRGWTVLAEGAIFLLQGITHRLAQHGHKDFYKEHSPPCSMKLPIVW